MIWVKWSRNNGRQKQRQCLPGSGCVELDRGGGRLERAGCPYAGTAEKQYPGIVFHLAQEKDAGDLAALAVQAGTGVHLYLSREFVGRMGSSREDFSQCWSELVSAAGTLSAKQGQTRAVGAFLGEDGTSYWSVQDKTEKEAVPVVSHTGAQETPSAGSDPRVRVSVSLNVSSHFFPGGQGPHQGSGAGGCVGHLQVHFQSEEGGSLR